MHKIIKEQLLKLPKTTLGELLGCRQSDKNNKNLIKLDSVISKCQKQSSSLIEVKEPFYINRLEHQKHHQSEPQQQKCLACLYKILRPFQKIPKKKFLHSSRLGYPLNPANRISSHRRSQEAQTGFLPSLQRCRLSEGDKDTFKQKLRTIIKQRLESLHGDGEQNFYGRVNRYCQDEQIVNLSIKYLANSSKFKEKLSSRGNFSDLSSLEIHQLFDEDYFIKYIKSSILKNREASTNQNRKFIQILNPSLKKRRSPHKQCSIKCIEPQRKEREEHRQKITAPSKKKGRAHERSSGLGEVITQAKLICGGYFIEGEIELNAEAKQKLNEIAKKKYNYFKGAIETIDDYVQEKVTQNHERFESLKKKVEMVTHWMKACIPNTDIEKNLKSMTLNEFVKTITNLPRNQRRKSSRKHHSNSTQQRLEVDRTKNEAEKLGEGASRCSQQYQQDQKDGVRELNQERGLNMPSPLSDSVDTTEKLIREEVYDTYQVVIQQNRGCVKSERKKSDLKPLTKSSFVKHSKELAVDLGVSLIDEEVLVGRQVSAQPSVDIVNKIKQDRTQQPLESILVQIQNIYFAQESVEKQKQERKRMFLKIKAGELLKHHQEIIFNVENHLKDFSLHQLIINPTDCVLTKKKKIRRLRELIRVRSLSHRISQKIINEIIKYLQVFEENCQILMQKLPALDSANYSSNANLKLEHLVSKKQIYNQLLFYDLRKNCDSTILDDQDIAYVYFEKVKNDRSWDIPTQSIATPEPKLAVLITPKKQKNFNDELIQMEMSGIARLQLCPASSCFAKNKYGLQSPQNIHDTSSTFMVESRGRFLVTEND